MGVQNSVWGFRCWVAEPDFGVKQMAEQTHGLMFKVWTFESWFGVKGLTGRNQALGFGRRSQGLG